MNVCRSVFKGGATEGVCQIIGVRRAYTVNGYRLRNYKLTNRCAVKRLFAISHSTV